MYRYGSICEPDIIMTFKNAGFTVDEYTVEMSKKDITPKQAIQGLSDHLMEHPADFVFSINFFPYVSEVCNVFHIRYLCWIVDSPVMELYTTSIENEWNRVFLFDRALWEEIEPFNPGHIFHLPLGAAVGPKDELFKKTSDAVKKKLSHDISFVGSLYTEKCPYDKLYKDAPAKLLGYLDGIMAAQEKVYGYYFIEELLDDDTVEGFKKNFPTFYRLPETSHLNDRRTLSQLYIGNKISANERVHTFSRLSERYDVSIYTASDTSGMPKGLHNMGLAKTLTEMPVIFHEAGINLNITSKIIRTGLPLRIFDILSCGGFLITNYQPEIPELFVPGEDLVMYGSIDELIELCGYYLDHRDEAKRIAEHGYDTLRQNYTYDLQMEKLLLKAFDI
mgnify:CR=1 FL=1